MISTVAASTVSAITSVTSATSAVAGSTVAGITVAATSSVTAVTTTLGFSMAALSVIAVVLLVLCLCGKEMAAANNNRVFKVFARRLDIGIVPLAIVFTLIVVTEVLKILF